MNWYGRVLSALNNKFENNTINIEGGFGPTGLPHIGTLCEIVRTQIIKQELCRNGYKVNYFLVSDDLDTFRKIPDNVPKKDQLIPYIGKPVSSVPDPYGLESSFSEMAENRLMNLARKYDIDCKLIRNSECYRNGEYNQSILKFLTHYEEINRLCSLSTGHLRRRTYSIFMPFSPLTGKVLEHIKITGINIDKGEITYIIPADEVVNKPGYNYGVTLSDLYDGEILDKPQTVSVLNGACKLQWKADWAMRQMARNIHFEMHGEDLRTSAILSTKIAEILNYTAPLFYPYGLFLDERGKKISKSKGNGFSLNDAEKLLSIEAIKNFLNLDPRRSRRFYPNMSPLLNDAADIRIENELSNQKLVRLISAFCPINYESAQRFASDKKYFPHSVREEKLNRCLNLILKDTSVSQTGVNKEQAENLKKIASVFKNRNVHNDKLDVIMEEMKKIYPDLSSHDLYKVLYRGLFGRDNGPRLKTWLNIHNDNDIFEKLNSPVTIGSHSLDEPIVPKVKPSESDNARRNKKNMLTPELSGEIDFLKIQDRCASLAYFLRESSDEIVSSLSDYQCSNVTLDEIERSCDLLENIHLNETYFKKTIRGVTSFLPLNQPLYASVCFGFIPALMAENVCIRPPTAMHEHYKKLISVIRLPEFCHSLKISYDEKEVFLSERVNVTDAIIFTGTPENAAKVRKHFKKNVLFILNGAGHNPVVISEDASLEKSIKSCLSVVLYNQGQDCAGPNAILVHKNIFTKFRNRLLDALQDMTHKVGDYKGEGVIVGPNSDPDHTLKISSVFKHLREHCIYGGEVNPVNGLIKPTVFVKPLIEGGNYKEFFAPVFFLQPYDDDNDLCKYFFSPEYRNNAMYVSLFGSSKFISDALPEELHRKESILNNTDLHREERGFLPYGGSGAAASCVWINGERITGSTLPQRDIFNYLVKPYLPVQ